MSTIVNKFSGLLGISGVSSDMRELQTARGSGNKRAELAFSMFTYRIKKYVGAYAAAMGGMDILLFTGGIGENDITTRKEVCEGLEFMGVELDQELNKQIRGEEAVISTPNSKVKVVVIPTDEELMIASDTESIVMEK